METWQVINTTTWHAGDNLTIKNIASYAEFRETARYSIQGDNFLVPGTNTNAFYNIQLNNTPGYNNSSQNTYTEELQFIGTGADGKLNWQAGGYFENSDPLGFTSQWTAIGLQCADTFNFKCTAAPAINFGPSVGRVFISTLSIPFQKTWFRSRGLYAQGTYKFSDQFGVTAGIRYTWDTMTHRYDGVAVGFDTTNVPTFFCSNTARVTGPTSPTNPKGVVFIGGLSGHDACNVTFTVKSSAPTWLIDFEYTPNPDTLIYAKWSRGYRAGGAASANIFFETWQPEKVDTYEIGGKLTFRGPVRGYFNLAGFYNDFRNQQIQHTLVRASTSPLLGGSAIINAGKSRIWGIEVDASATLFDSLKIDVGYTYLNTKVLELAPVVLTPQEQLFWSIVPPTAVPNGRLALSPSHRLTLSGTYTLPLDPSLGTISIGATYVYTSDQNISSRAVTPLFYQIPDQHLLNLSLNWNDFMGQPIDISAFATNVTNNAYPQAVAQAWQSYGYESQLFNEPRMYGVRLRYNFGR
jgi:iron complex outermembrane receptor protein